ncbi:uncharacterized protein LOC135641398 [Musa acuminata AAA Group]|uniref:uncharacterized protein LOC135641398 n=1 Tax=Musa acuminata AAA Group TaxID=214697 RepID=UPI0031D1BD6E
MSQEHLTGALPEGEPSTGHPSAGPGDQPLPAPGEGRVPASTPDYYWRLFNDPELLPPGLTTGPSDVTPKAFLSLTKQVQTMAGMMQTLVPLIPQIRGHLSHYLKEPREVTPCPRGPVERQIDIISGGPAASGNSSASRKAYARSTIEKRPRPKHEPEITFGAGEVERSHHDDALVISVQVTNARVKKVMVDTGSSADVLYFDAFKKLGLTERDLTPMASVLTGFTRDSISSLRTTIILITMGEDPRAKIVLTTFMVVDLPSTYNIILGRPTLNKLKAVVSTTTRPSSFRPR